MKTPLILAGIFFTGILHAQWTQRASLTGPARTNAVGFSVGGKGYVATGFDGSTWLNDCWEYDPAGNNWTQKAAMPDNGREGAFAFVIGSLAYVGTGKRDTVFKNDFYEFNPAANTWTPRANFPGTARSEASAFSIGTNGYAGIGYDGINKFDFYQWTQSTNTWTPRANFTGNARNSAIGFALSNGRGYFGSGYASGNVYQDIFEYNPSTNAWLWAGTTSYQAYSMAASTFAVTGNYVFYCCGIDDNSVYYNNFAQWDPSFGSGNLAPFTGTARYNAVSFSITGRFFLGTGFDSWVTDDLWEYTITISNEEIEQNEWKPAVYINQGGLIISTEAGVMNGRVRLFNMMGKNCFCSEFSKDKTEFDISGMSSGIYLVELECERGRFVEKIFIP